MGQRNPYARTDRRLLIVWLVLLALNLAALAWSYLSETPR